MPRPGLRVRALRKIRKKIPGGASIIFYFKKKPSPPRCAKCGKPLHGINPKSKKKTDRKVFRIYGGYLCSACAREEIKAKARGD